MNDSVTVSGSNLEKGTVAAVFLSDDKTDYKAAIVEQAADKIVMKVPQVKPGSYNVSIQVGTGILIEPVRFTVQYRRVLPIPDAALCFIPTQRSKSRDLSSMLLECFSEC